MRDEILRVMAAAVVAMAAGSAAAYTFGESRSAASTEIFGYDWATLPKTGNELRTDAFVTLPDTNKVFHLYDMSVRGYDRAVGSAGVFGLSVMEIVNGEAVAVRDDQGRELRFYWYDVPQNAQPNLVRTPGWYDEDGTNRWENMEFLPGQAFVVHGNGLKLETFGLVLDTEVRVKVPCNRQVAVGQGWAKHANLCDIAMASEGTNNISGGVMLQTLKPSLERDTAYCWCNVTNGCAVTDARYREPGWYSNNCSKAGLYTRESGVVFDMGRAFWLQGCQANPGEPEVECEFTLPSLRLFMKDYEPWSEL